VFTSMVGTITNIMQQIQSLKESETRQFWLVRRFLLEHNISQDLGIRVRKFLQHAASQELMRIGPESIEIFRLLSEPLFGELQFERYQEAFCAHPFFKRILTVRSSADFPRHVIHNVAREATSCAWIAPGDIVFCTGDIACCSHFVMGGCLTYDRNFRTLEVRTGRWISDAVLWTSWRHQGVLEGAEPSQLLKLNADSFGKVVSRHVEYSFLARKFASRIVIELNKRSPDYHTDLSTDTKWSLRSEGSPQSLAWWKQARLLFR